MKYLAECSSVYAIDFAAIAFCDIIDNGGEKEYCLFINDSADVTSSYRKYISRLAIPTLNWERDPQGQLRQIHKPIEDIKSQDEFYNTISCVAKTVCQNEIWYNTFIDELKTFVFRMEKFNSLDAYIGFIELLLSKATGKQFRINKFGKYRANLSVKDRKEFFELLIQSVIEKGIGKYSFSKGGYILIHTNENEHKIKEIQITNNDLLFIDDSGERWLSQQLIDSEYFSLRGPLEIVFLCSKGFLVDLPWYSNAYFDKKKNWGIEYISPISVSDINRVSCLAGGNGYRLNPSAYSLIDYQSEKVLNVIRNIYPQNEIDTIKWEDLADWELLINNYPICNQKIAKSQASVKAYFDTLISGKLRSLNSDNSTMRRNYPLLGFNLTNLCYLFKLLREFFHYKSPYYACQNHIENIIKISDRLTIQAIMDYLTSLLSETVCFLKYFDGNLEICTELQHFIEKNKFIFSFNIYDQANYEQLYSAISRIEILLRRIIVQYYEIAAFICGALLKANLFTALCVLGDSYSELVNDIYRRREVKKLSFIPTVLKESGGNLDACTI